MNKPYFCTKCHREHIRGQIYEEHMKYKEKNNEIQKTNNFIMKGKKGEDLEVRTKELNNSLRINIYKYNSLACSTEIKTQEQLLTKNYIRNYIENNCI